MSKGMRAARHRGPLDAWAKSYCRVCETVAKGMSGADWILFLREDAQSTMFVAGLACCDRLEQSPSA